jgi:hypothetical protein
MSDAHLFHHCGWCGLPATREVTVQPAIFRKRNGADELVQLAIMSWACDTHPTAEQPADMTTFRRRKAKGVEQLDLFGQPANRPGNALLGDG